MGKGERVKRNEMFSDYCMQQNCGMYMEWLEQRVAELEFQLGLKDSEKSIVRLSDQTSDHEKIKEEYYERNK